MVTVKKYILIIVCLIIILILLILCKPKKIEKKLDNNIDMVEVIYNKLKDNDIDYDFIKWINDNYDNALTKLDKLLENKEYDLNVWHEITGNSYIVLNDLYNHLYDNMDNVKIIKTNNNGTISFVGDVSLADNWFIAPKYDEGGINRILSSDMLDIMRSSDVMIANSEFTVSDRGNKLPNKMYTFRATPSRLAIYEEMGIDLVTLANNHVYDYGSIAFNDMLDAFLEYNIPHIGAGHNIE